MGWGVEVVAMRNGGDWGLCGVPICTPTPHGSNVSQRLQLKCVKFENKIMPGDAVRPRFACEMTSE